MFRFLFIILFLCSESIFAVVQVHSIHGDIPLEYDAWCDSNCASHQQCLGLFGKDYVDLRIRSKFSSLKGPGESLVRNKYLGDTISKQSFETQFILDLSSSLSISPCRIYIITISPEKDEQSWDPNNVFITFRLFLIDVAEIRNLTVQIQDPLSTFNRGQVTEATDSSFGVVVLKWDFSVKLMYSINIIGESKVETVDNIQLLNHGSQQWCTNKTNINSTYCDFEAYFKEDISQALSIKKDQVDVIFIKESSRDSIVVTFRLIPFNTTNTRSTEYHDSNWISERILDLIEQMKDIDSSLYQGNVTFRIDPTWGVSKDKETIINRSNSKYLNRAVDDAYSSAYERCKATQRCNRAWNRYLYSPTRGKSTMQYFAGGEHLDIGLFADFEDWRQGSLGWEQNCDWNISNPVCVPQSNDNSLRLIQKGAHWSPFNFKSLGPTIPSFNSSSNNGLVLNREELQSQIAEQYQWINEIKGKIDWIKSKKMTTSLDAKIISRIDITNIMLRTQRDYENLLEKEDRKLLVLSQSQCMNAPCTLLFNTSNLKLTGAINATGEVALTSDETEVAVWSFDSINLGSEVTVNITGQRAMALLSKSSVRINTTLNSQSGTLGGFPGGYSSFREKDQRLLSVCSENLGKSIHSKDCIPSLLCCPGDRPLSQLTNETNSNNINGPGSGSVRVYLHTIETKAQIVHEVKAITTDANMGQHINGGFILHYKGYNSSFIAFDATASRLKEIMEDTLNAAKLNILHAINRENVVSGVGNLIVSKKMFGLNGGSQWKVTFISSIGNTMENKSESLTVTNLLNGVGASVSISTIINGNTIGGFFTISFLGSVTRRLNHNISAQDLKLSFQKDLQAIISVNVTRTNPLGNCNDGLCENGPQQAGGHLWTIYSTTNVGNISPFSPTSLLFDQEGTLSQLGVKNELTGCIDSICPTIEVVNGHSKSIIKLMRNIQVNKPFSLTYGGGGASHGGEGGEGFGDNLRGKIYGDKFVRNLHGGSGGALGYKYPFELTMTRIPGKSRGGSGGGAIEIVAASDIIIGSNSALSCKGEQGWNGSMTAGGGGSGGSILFAAGGIIKINGNLSVAGGHGGIAWQPTKRKDLNGHGGGGGGGGGRIAMYAQSIIVNDEANIDLAGGECNFVNLGGSSVKSRDCNGKAGTFYTDQFLSQIMFVDEKIGAFGTNRSLYIKGINQKYELPINKLAGPELIFVDPQRSERISFFIRLEQNNKVGTTKRTDWGVMFELRTKTWSNVVASANETFTSAIGIFIGKEMKHGSNYYGLPFSTNHLKVMKTFHKNTILEQWYKIDLHINWTVLKYDIYLDDYLIVRNSSFEAQSIKSVSISNYHNEVGAWVDEIFIGNDSTLGFKCPDVKDYNKHSLEQLNRRGWKTSELGSLSSNHQMKRHESHLSRRSIYSRDDKGGILPFDGEGHHDFISDLNFRDEHKEGYSKDGMFLGGSLLKSPYNRNEYVWYGEYSNINEGNVGSITDKFTKGGVTACSTKDFIKWKNEGTMIHYVNLTDMVHGSNNSLHVERPKVLYNNETQQYVMWMIIDNEERSLAMAGVATSKFINGPFSLIRSFYPDGNQTRDQTLFQKEDGTAYLIRSYYTTLEYVSPSPIMYPMWESVKNSDNSTNFPLTYHRAHYEANYDDYHDIYLQRWRKEDKGWKVVCVNRATLREREIPYGKEYYNEKDELCNSLFETKIVLGQSSAIQMNARNGIKSRFLDPLDPSNNHWKPESVPGVQSQPWSANYVDGTCGIRKMNDDIQRYDSNLPKRKIHSRKNCSNIADNPTHYTPPDRLIGVKQIVQKRQAKFVAVSRLTNDYLDTSGVLETYEGELEGDIDLISIVNRAEGNIFASDSGNDIKSTYIPQIHSRFKQETDSDTRFHQYEQNFNDRALYSTSCLFDKNCPVNFKDQVEIDGN